MKVNCNKRFTSYGVLYARVRVQHLRNYYETWRLWMSMNFFSLNIHVHKLDKRTWVRKLCMIIVLPFFQFRKPTYSLLMWFLLDTCREMFIMILLVVLREFAPVDFSYILIRFKLMYYTVAKL